MRGVRCAGFRARTDADMLLYTFVIIDKIIVMVTMTDFQVSCRSLAVDSHYVNRGFLTRFRTTSPAIIICFNLCHKAFRINRDIILAKQEYELFIPNG